MGWAEPGVARDQPTLTHSNLDQLWPFFQGLQGLKSPNADLKYQVRKKTN